MTPDTTSTTQRPSAAAGPATAGSGPAAAAEPRPVELVGVIALRELLARLRDRTFIVSTAFLLVVVGASVAVPLLLADDGAPEITVATVGEPAGALARSAAALGAEAAERAEAAEDGTGGDAATGTPGSSAPATVPGARITVREVPDAGAAEALVRSGAAQAAVVPAGSALQVVAEREVPSELSALLAGATATREVAAALQGAGLPADQAERLLATAAGAAPQERLLDPPPENADLAIGITVAFAFLFFLTSFLFGMAIAQSVVEEKQSRIVEILVAAVPVRLLLAGKVLGNTALALGQTAMLVAVGLAGASVAGQSALVSLLLHSGGWFLVFFLLGFSMLACLWAAAGAVAGRQEDLQATTVPLQVLLFGPFFAATYVTDTGPVLTTLSYIPFTSPLTMPRRLLLDDAAWWEPVVSAGLVVATAVAFVALATRIYERSVLRSGSRVSWSAALGLRRGDATGAAS